MLLMLGDCLQRLKEIPENSVDMVLTDPPYGTTACKWDTVIPFEPMWKELKRVTKDNSAICLFGSEPFSSNLRMSNIKQFRYDWTWKKQRGSGHLNSKKQPLRDVEIISVFYRRQCTYIPQNLQAVFYPKTKHARSKPSNLYNSQGSPGDTTVGKYPKQVLEFDALLDFKNKDHPTQKPVALLEYLIKTYTKEGDTVLDFTMGSGSTGVAAKNLGREFIGIEMNEEYFAIAEKRIG